MGLIKTAAQILQGRPRPVDEPLKTRRNNGGRKPMYGPVCLHCKSEPHHARGLGQTCYSAWRLHRSGPVQPFEPVYPVRGVQPCREAAKGCTKSTGPRCAHGWCQAHYRRWKLYGDPWGHAPNIKQCRAKGCDHSKELAGGD